MKLSLRRKKIITTVIIVLLVLAIPISGAFVFINTYLNKINYDNNTTLKADPSFTENVSSPELSEADDNIKKNISDNRFWYNENVINILLIGCDYGEYNKHYGRSDAMIIASINKRDHKISYVSLSRATYVSIPGYGNARLNAAYAYGGPNLLVKTIELNYKTRIDNYIAVDFNGFKDIIDIMGGISIELTNDEVKYHKALLNSKGLDTSKGAGTYKLDGELALAYARTRAIDTDRDRTQRQRNIMTQLTYKARNLGVSKGLDVLNSILPLVTTDFTKYELVSQASNAVKYVSWSIDEAIIPRNTPGLKTINGYEVIVLNWDKVRTDIHEQLYPNMEPVEKLPE
jgi:LCP family protein required for cell wall assembly